ncbi:MAG: thioredoxin domain-containing protein [Syntrophobacteraceae bacterium]
MSHRNKKDLQNKQPSSEISPFAASSPKNIPLLVISLLGLLVSLLSGLHESIPFAASICTNACADTTRMHFLHVPLWVWGIVFYLLAAALAIFRQEALAWIAFCAAGVEAVLVFIMVRMHLPCIFCIANAAVVAVLLALAFRKELVWQQATLGLLFFVVFLFLVPFENSLPFFTAANAGAGRQEYAPAAKVGNEVITNQRLDVLLGSSLLQLRTQIYQMKMQRLDQLIEDGILAREAKKEGKTVDQLVKGLTASVNVSDAEVAQYMQEHQQQLQVYEKTVPNLKQRIQQGLLEQKKQMAIRNYAQSLEARYGVKIFLPVPKPPTVTVDTSGAPALGPKNAPVTVIEFSDYQCPACRANHPVVKQIRKEFAGKLRWIYMEYPLHIHQYAFEAAEAGLCAEDQGKFWQYQDDLYTTPDLTVPNLIAMAKKMGMSGKKFSQCLSTSKYKAQVKKSMAQATQIGIDRTPTYVINGMVFIGGPSLDRFKNVIEEALQSAGIRKQIARKAK